MSKLLYTLSILFILSACTNSVNEKEFATQESIDKILLANSNGEKVVLTKKENEWFVNDKFKTRKDMTKILLNTLKKVKVNYPVPVKSEKDIIKEIAANHVKAELYSDNNKVRSYFVGGHTQDQMGTYMYMEGAQKAYVCHIPGFEGYLTPRFFTKEEDWRSRNVFEGNPSAIQSISVQYDSSLSFTESFHIQKGKDGKYGVAKNNKEAINFDVHQENIQQYLTFFKALSIEGFANDFSKKDSITDSNPFCTITVEYDNQSKKEMQAYFMDLTQRSKTQFNRKGDKLEHDMDRMYAAFNNKSDFGIIQLFVFGKIFQNYSTFQ